jgi:hypothetical protein
MRREGWHSWWQSFFWKRYTFRVCGLDSPCRRDARERLLLPIMIAQGQLGCGCYSYCCLIGFDCCCFYSSYRKWMVLLHSYPAKKELQFNCSLTIVFITRVIWPQNYSFFSSNNCSFSSIQNAVLLLSLLKYFDKKRFDLSQDRSFNSGVDNPSR